MALNWWYDMEMRGMTWVLLSFLRGIEDVPSGNEDVREGRYMVRDVEILSSTLRI